ncbi:unnamed protein product [Adineta steineri]|uniref:PKS/mFAS DH domain-containing protein n=1 Tax=Adineta steineri TaxID=433720 RepID=A0A814X0N1_9BILA|nr:unnamed protein product [Adineta steineri]CAF1444485.1 unnamed protein product [Adineta steineri]
MNLQLNIIPDLQLLKQGIRVSCREWTQTIKQQPHQIIAKPPSSLTTTSPINNIFLTITIRRRTIVQNTRSNTKNKYTTIEINNDLSEGDGRRASSFLADAMRRFEPTVNVSNTNGTKRLSTGHDESDFEVNTSAGIHVQRVQQEVNLSFIRLFYQFYTVVCNALEYTGIDEITKPDTNANTNEQQNNLQDNSTILTPENGIQTLVLRSLDPNILHLDNNELDNSERQLSEIKPIQSLITTRKQQRSGSQPPNEHVLQQKNPTRHMAINVTNKILLFSSFGNVNLSQRLRALYSATNNQNTRAYDGSLILQIGSTSLSLKETLSTSTDNLPSTNIPTVHPSSSSTTSSNRQISVLDIIVGKSQALTFLHHVVSQDVHDLVNRAGRLITSYVQEFPFDDTQQTSSIPTTTNTDNEFVNTSLNDTIEEPTTPIPLEQTITRKLLSTHRKDTINRTINPRSLRTQQNIYTSSKRPILEVHVTTQCQRMTFSTTPLSTLKVQYKIGIVEGVANIDGMKSPLFAIQVGLAALLVSWNIYPPTIVSHSAGDQAAAFVADRLSLEETVRMLAISMGKEEVENKLLKSIEHLACIAVVNSRRRVTISGDKKTIDEIQQILSISYPNVFETCVPTNVFLKISPHPVLVKSTRECYELTNQQQSSPLILLTLKRKENEQTSATWKSLININLPQHAFLKDHKIQGAILFPAVASLELATAACHQLLSSKEDDQQQPTIIFENVNFFKALILNEHELMEVFRQIIMPMREWYIIFCNQDNRNKYSLNEFTLHAQVLLPGIETTFLPVRIQKFIYSNKTKIKINQSTNIEVRGKYHDNICGTSQEEIYNLDLWIFPMDNKIEEPIFTSEGAVIQQCSTCIIWSMVYGKNNL